VHSAKLWYLSYGTIYNKETQLFVYADDIDIVSRSKSAVRDAYLALEGEVAKVGLKINEQKTKYMIAARNDRTIRDVGQNFEVVKKFVYLGSLMTRTNDLSLEIQRRIQTTNRCFSGLLKHLQSSRTFHARQNSPCTRPWSTQSCSTSVKRGCWPKGRRTNCSYLRVRFSELYAARKSKMVSTGEDTTTNSIKSLTARMP
jgi:hypothetical protein